MMKFSWYVNYITDDGLIYVIRNGGSDHQIAPSKRVNIHTKKESLKVFWMASYPYSKRRKEETPKISNLFIDIGCETKEEVDKMAFM
jgi:putative aminopeptidase FrvX